MLCFTLPESVYSEDSSVGEQCIRLGAATRRSQAAAVLRLTTTPSYRPPIGRQPQPSPPGPTIAHCLTLHTAGHPEC